MLNPNPAPPHGSLYSSEETSREISAASRIDHALPFMPEQLSHLAHVPAYMELPSHVKLRYNQLNALYFNEQAMFFEVLLIHFIRNVAETQPVSRELRGDLERFARDEEMHTRMFRALNRAAAPRYYANEDFIFIRLGPQAERLTRMAMSRPRLFPFFVWLLHIHEERSLYFAREFVRSAEGLEPHFVNAQAIHMRDEEEHIAIDAALLQVLWDGRAPLLLRANVALFGWMMREFFTAPKRAGIRVVEVLCEELPDAKPHFPRLKAELLALNSRPDYHELLYSRRIVPKTMALFDRYPEFAGFGRFIRGYEPRFEGEMRA